MPKSKSYSVEEARPEEFIPIFGNSAGRARQETQNAMDALTDSGERYEDLYNDPANYQKIQSSQAGRATGSSEGRDASLAALKALLERSRSGLTMQDLASINNMNIAAGQNAQGANQQLVQGAANKGQLTSGQLLAARQRETQNSYNQAQQQGLMQAGQSQAQALQAALGAGNLGQSVDKQQFGQNFQKGGANDAVNQFNTQLTQQAFNNKSDLANYLNNLEQSKQGIRLQNAGIQTQQAANTRAGVGQAIGTIAGAALGGVGGAGVGSSIGGALTGGGGGNQVSGQSLANSQASQLEAQKRLRTARGY